MRQGFLFHVVIQLQAGQACRVSALHRAVQDSQSLLLCRVVAWPSSGPQEGGQNCTFSPANFPSYPLDPNTVAWSPPAAEEALTGWPGVQLKIL